MNLDEYNDNIIELDLSRKGLNTIPNLTRFKNLKKLFLDCNKISDISPLQYLTNLKELWLNVNYINDISPLQYLTNLEVLKLHSNNISDITHLQHLTKLKELILSIETFIVKEINPQLLINQQLDNEIIKQVYQSYTKDELKDYENKVKEKFKDYKFIKWVIILIKFKIT